MTQLRQAVVIPFPARSPASRPEAASLSFALGKLNAALAAQREAFADWRGSLAALDASIKQLDGSARAYFAQLSRLSGDLGVLRSHSAQLTKASDADQAPPVSVKNF